jgi:hypothetical protein
VRSRGLLPARGQSNATSYDDPRQWRAQADEARDLAQQMTNPEGRQILMRIALGYMELAQMAERREATRRTGPWR